MTDEQKSDVRALTTAAGISATTTRVDSADHPTLRTLAPGERTLVPGGYVPATPPAPQKQPKQGQRPNPQPQSGGGAGGGRRRRRRAAHR